MCHNQQLTGSRLWKRGITFHFTFATYHFTLKMFSILFVCILYALFFSILFYTVKSESHIQIFIITCNIFFLSSMFTSCFSSSFFSEKHHKSTRTWKHKFITGNEITRSSHVPLPLLTHHRSKWWLICCHYITFFSASELWMVVVIVALTNQINRLPKFHKNSFELSKII